MANAKTSTDKTASKETKTEQTFTKAGPGSRSGGKNRGSNGANRTYSTAVLDKRREDAVKAAAETKRAEREADIKSRLEFRRRQCAAAAEMIASTTKHTYRKPITVRDKETNAKKVIQKRVSVTITEDMRLGATALLEAFPEATPKRDEQISRTQKAVNTASLGVMQEILVDQKRYEDFLTGFDIAKEFLPLAYNLLNEEKPTS